MPEQCEIGVDELGEKLRKLRLSTPAQQQAMERSLCAHGQLSAVLVNRAGERLEVIDGFKRLRAARALQWARVQVNLLTLEPAEVKLRMLHSNSGTALSEIEQAWVIRSLYRDDGLSQPRIAQLFGRHKSWVNRRLLLAEELGDEVQADLRLGLITATAARQLARLPRGNQAELAGLVTRRGLTSRQSEKLVEAWLAAVNDQQRQQVIESAGTQAAARSIARRPAARSDCEWMVEDIDQMVRRAGRLQARLLDRPLTSHGDGAAEIVGQQLRRLTPVLTALGETISRAVDGRHQISGSHSTQRQEQGRNDPKPVAQS